MQSRSWILIFGLAMCCAPLMMAQSSREPADTTNPFLDNPFREVGGRTPYVHVGGGFATWSLDGAADIANSTVVGATLGFEQTRRIPNHNILQHRSNGLFVQHATEGTRAADGFSMKGWRFGSVASTSYAYAFSETGSSGLYFTVASAPLSWTILTPGTANSMGLAGAEALNRFSDGLRFGEASTASIGVRVADPVSITASAEWALVYERHLFWYWAGSSIIEGVADGVATWFVREIGKNAPGAMPVMHFLIRNGIAAGFKALRVSQMNWPFDSAPPLSMITYQVGVQVHF